LKLIKAFIEALEPAAIGRLLLQLSSSSRARMSSKSLTSAFDFVTRGVNFRGLAISFNWFDLALVLGLDRVCLSFNLVDLVGCALLNRCNLSIVG